MPGLIRSKIDAIVSILNFCIQFPRLTLLSLVTTIIHHLIFSEQILVAQIPQALFLVS